MLLQGGRFFWCVNLGSVVISLRFQPALDIYFVAASIQSCLFPLNIYFIRWGKFLRNSGAVSVREYNKIILVLSTGLIMCIGHRKGISKLNFRVLAYRQSDWRRANANLSLYVIFVSSAPIMMRKRWLGTSIWQNEAAVSRIQNWLLITIRGTIETKPYLHIWRQWKVKRLSDHLSQKSVSHTLIDRASHRSISSDTETTKGMETKSQT